MLIIRNKELISKIKFRLFTKLLIKFLKTINRIFAIKLSILKSKKFYL